MATHIDLGRNAEQIALRYLQRQGLVLRQQNFSCARGEIDLIMEHGNTLVFVEVRYRGKSQFGDGIESISPSKCRKIIATANYYLLCEDLTDKVYCRFDVIALDSLKTAPEQVIWFQDAFQADSYS